MALNCENGGVALKPEMENTSFSRRIWGPWATVGFGIAVIVIYSIIQGLVVFFFAIGEALSLVDNLPGSIQSEDVVSAVGLVLSSNLGLLIALGTIASAIVCLSLNN